MSERDERWRTERRRKNVDFIVGKGLLKKYAMTGHKIRIGELKYTTVHISILL